jgi:hypothetical protein
MKIIISYGLFGDSKKYLEGAVENARLCREFYECLGEITPVFWIGGGVPVEILAMLDAYEAVTVPFEKWSRATKTATVARFFAADLPADAFFVRDVDSRPSTREVAAMAEWQGSNQTFHVMRDHPYHYAVVLAGMWGGLSFPFKGHSMRERFLRWKREHPEPAEWYGYCQEFLADEIWPTAFEFGLMQHDTFYRDACGGKTFPEGDRPGAFVGEVIEKDGHFNQEHREVRDQALKEKKLCEPL